jgi:hypothetical protein
MATCMGRNMLQQILYKYTCSHDVINLKCTLPVAWKPNEIKFTQNFHNSNFPTNSTKLCVMWSCRRVKYAGIISCVVRLSIIPDAWNVLIRFLRRNIGSNVEREMQVFCWQQWVVIEQQLTLTLSMIFHNIPLQRPTMKWNIDGIKVTVFLTPTRRRSQMYTNYSTISAIVVSAEFILINIKYYTTISLQSTRNEDNLETEETLARAAVTLETGRAKWPNPCSLWRWWWWFYNTTNENECILCLRNDVSQHRLQYQEHKH